MTLLTANGDRLPGEVRGAFVVPIWVKPGIPPPTDVPQSLKAFNESVRLKNALRERIPTTYILTVDPGAQRDQFDSAAARAKAKGWLVE